MEHSRLPALLSLSWPTSLLYLLVTIPFHPANASVGVVDINDLFLSKDQQPLHSSKSSKSYAPWSHQPHCTHSTSFSSLGQKYCVYTSNTTSVNGISIISTPKVAEEASVFLDEDPLSHFLTQEQAENLFYNTPPYAVDEIEGKGKGVVATRLIRKYETFMVDQASVLMDLALEKNVLPGESLDMLKVAVERLRKPALVKDLSGKHNGDGDSEGGMVEEDIMMTNAFGTTIAGEGMRGLFPLVSRINHACNPNAFVLFSHTGISIGIKAYRDIQPGEEINISYLLLGQPSTRRASGLQRWGFTCTCALCSLPGPEKTASDVRRKHIESSEKRILDLWREGRIRSAISLAEEVVDVMKEEDILPMLADEYTILARLYLVLDEREKAEEYGALALELLGDLGFLGAEPDEEWGLERLLGVLGERGLYD